MGDVIDFDTGKVKVINNKFDYFEMGKNHMLKDNYKQVFSYYKQGDEAGCDKCQLALGVMYFEGVGVKQNIDEALKFLEKSANQGNSEAHLCLGNIYYSKGDTVKDLEKALFHYKNAPATYYMYMKLSKLDEILNNHKEPNIESIKKDLDKLLTKS
jgi:hypothetical protein